MRRTERFAEIKFKLLMTGKDSLPMDVVQDIVDLGGITAADYEAAKALLEEQGIDEEAIRFKKKQRMNQTKREAEESMEDLPPGLKDFAEMLLKEVQK